MRLIARLRRSRAGVNAYREWIDERYMSLGPAGLAAFEAGASIEEITQAAERAEAEARW